MGEGCCWVGAGARASVPNALAHAAVCRGGLSACGKRGEEEERGSITRESLAAWCCCQRSRLLLPVFPLAAWCCCLRSRLPHGVAACVPACLFVLVHGCVLCSSWSACCASHLPLPLLLFDIPSPRLPFVPQASTVTTCCAMTHPYGGLDQWNQLGFLDGASFTETPPQQRRVGV